MKNTLTDLNNHLFAALERLNDEEITGERLKEELDRARTISLVGKTVVENARLVLDAQIELGGGKAAQTASTKMLLGNEA